MKQVLFFINPHAGHAEIRSSLMEVLEIFSVAGYEATVHMTAGPRDITSQIAARGTQYDLIVCTGGDGTLNEAVSGLMALPYEKRPPLGYIPGGTVNDVAATLGLSKDPIRAARDIVAGRLYPLDIGSFGPDRYFTYVAAFGIFTDVPYETPQEDKRIWGRLAYIMNGAGALGRLRTRMCASGMTITWRRRTCWSVLSRAQRPSAGSRPRGISAFRSTTACTRWCSCARRRRWQSSIWLRRARCGWILSNDSFISAQTGALRFEFDEPVAWTVDGEFGGSVTEVEIHNEHRAIDIVVP